MIPISYYANEYRTAIKNIDIDKKMKYVIVLAIFFIIDCLLAFLVYLSLFIGIIILGIIFGVIISEHPQIIWMYFFYLMILQVILAIIIIPLEHYMCKNRRKIGISCTSYVDVMTAT
jgi:hypothetical protein